MWTLTGNSQSGEVLVIVVLCRYATESIRLACQWAYRNATPGSTLGGNLPLTCVPQYMNSQELHVADEGLQIKKLRKADHDHLALQMTFSPAWFVACRWLLPLSAAYCGSKISTRWCEACCNPESPFWEFVTAHFVSLNVLRKKRKSMGSPYALAQNFGAWKHIVSSKFQELWSCHCIICFHR